MVYRISQTVGLLLYASLLSTSSPTAGPLCNPLRLEETTTPRPKSGLVHHAQRCARVITRMQTGLLPWR